MITSITNQFCLGLRWLRLRTENEALHKQLNEVIEDRRRCIIYWGLRTEQAEKRIGELETKNADLAKRTIEATSWANRTGDKIAAVRTENEALRKALEATEEALTPFAAAVFNDNGDMTVSPCHDSYNSFIAAYFAHRKARNVLRAVPAQISHEG